VNAPALEGRSVDALLSLRKLSDASKKEYLYYVGRFLSHTKTGPDALVKNAKRRPGAFEKDFVSFLNDVGRRGTSAACAALAVASMKKFLDVNRVEGIPGAAGTYYFFNVGGMASTYNVYGIVQLSQTAETKVTVNWPNGNYTVTATE
jgi:hypothetical protein